jgi:heme-degrading monooxygenase HmoA
VNVIVSVLRRIVVRLSRIAIHSPVRMSDRMESRARAEETVCVSIAHVLVDSAHRRGFERATRELLQQLPQTPGLLMHSVRRELLGNEAWTLTAWRSDADRRAFTASAEHGRAMASAGRAIAKMRTRQFVVPAADLPLGWGRALEMLERGGW